MRKILLCLLGLAFIIGPLAVQAQPAQALPASYSQHYGMLTETQLRRIRGDFTLATLGLPATRQAIQWMESNLLGPINSWPPVARAYRASLEGLIGMHETNLFRKYNQVKQALAMFDGIAESYPESMEIRFLRYAFFSQLPALFGVARHVPEDLADLFEFFESNSDQAVPLSLKLEMAQWLDEHGQLSLLQKERLEAAVAALRP